MCSELLGLVHQDTVQSMDLTAALHGKGRDWSAHLTGEKPREAPASQGQGLHPFHLCSSQGAWHIGGVLVVLRALAHALAHWLHLQPVSPGPRASTSLQSLLHPQPPSIRADVLGC